VLADIEGPISVHVDDTFLLCSDGLTGRIEDDELAAFLTHLPLEEAGQMLLDLANLRGGPDNITVILVKITDDELATPNDVAEPIKIGSRRPKAIQPAIWACIAVCILAAFVMVLTHNGILALVAIAGAVAALLVGLVSRVRGRSPGEVLGNGRKLGKGPYARAACPPSKTLADRLSAIASELRNSSAAANARLDWTGFDKYALQARESLNTGQSTAAISSYARAFRSIMQSIRESQNGHAGESDIDPTVDL
jgi:protein phosphatase